MEVINTKRILGVDPGFGRVGFGVLEENKGKYQYLTYGCIETDSRLPFSERLVIVHEEIKKILKKYKIHRAALEDLFFYKNIKTAIKVGQARGVILLTLQEFKLPIDEFTPLQVKQAVVGYGRAEKQQVQKMVKMLLNIPAKSIQDDAADALAIALTCAFCVKFTEKTKQR